MDRPVLTTRRLTLRPLRADDAPAIAAALGDWSVAQWLSSPPYPYGLADAESFIADHPEGVFAIDAGQGIIGTISVDASLGYWLAPAAWGQGYATEAGDAVIDWAFAENGAREISTSYLLGNEASRNVLKKLGFLDVGPRMIPTRAQGRDMPGHALTLSRARWRERRDYHVETDRLILRGLREDDWADLARIGGEAQVARMMFNLRSPWPEAEVRAWIDHARFRGRPGFRPAVTLKDGTLIGALGLGGSPGARDQSCAYFIGRDYWGQGYATEAMRAFLRDCFARFEGLGIVEADHFTDNPASGRVLQKLGFSRSGVGTGTSAARVEPASTIEYRLRRTQFEAANR